MVDDACVPHLLCVICMLVTSQAAYVPAYRSFSSNEI